MFNIFNNRRNASKHIDPIIRHIDKVLSSLTRKDIHEGFVAFLFQLYANPDYTVLKVAAKIGRSQRCIKYYRQKAYKMRIIKEYKSHVSGFQRPVTELDGMPKPLREETKKAILGYLNHRRTREEFLEIKKRTAENRLKLKEERKNNKDDDSNLPSSNGKPFLKDSSTTNKRFIESEKVKNLRFYTSAIPWYAKRFNIDKKITEKIILSDFKQIEHEITTLGRKYKSPIAVLIARIKKSLTIAKPILAKGQTFFTREERKDYKPATVRKAYSEVERFKRILKEQQQREALYDKMEQECAIDHDWNLVINHLSRAR